MTKQDDEYEKNYKYEAPENIDGNGIFESLRKLSLFSIDRFMISQAYNLGIEDNFITEIEYKILREWLKTDEIPELTFFLSAQSQMWIFAAYELLRTWHQRVNDILKWAKNGGLEKKLDALRTKNDSYMHYGREIRIRQIKSVIENPEIILLQIKRHKDHLHIPFKYLEYMRVAIAKHEISGQKKSTALAPGYGRINRCCGSLDYELEKDGQHILGYINRRDIADNIRHLDLNQDPPSSGILKDFDNYMSGKGLEDNSSPEDSP